MLKRAIGRQPARATPLDRSVFPVTRKYAYCNHAAVGPLPQSTRDALVAAFDAQMSDGCAGILDVEARREAVRNAVADEIGAAPDEIAFMRATSDGALLIANGLNWRDGDEVIFSGDEFGANAYPWLNLRRRGVEATAIAAPSERLTVATLEKRASHRTRLVAVSYVGFSDGYRHDVAALGAWCRRNGILFAVDAIQGFGHLPLDVAGWNIDFCYFGVAKWLLSPQALSVVYVRREHIERLGTAFCAWRSVRDPMNFLDYSQPLADGAVRFEGGTVNYPAIVAFGESLRLLTAAGMPAIEQHVLGLNARLVDGAQRAGVAVLSALEEHARSGIVLLGLAGWSADELARRADARGVQVTIRENGVRVSPHGYNTEEDVDRVLSIFER